MNFEGNILFELPLLRQPIRHLNKMQGMEKKYSGHAWCNMKTTNIKNDFGLGFQHSKCLGHLQYQNNACNKFFQSSVHNEVVWNGDSTHLPIVGHYVLSCIVFTIGCKLCGAMPFYTKTCKCWMYYVGHKLDTFSRTTIHLKTHVHSTQDDMCREANKVLFEREVFRTPNKKNFTIDLFANVSFMLQHLFNKDNPMARWIFFCSFW